jgi:ABC-type multidrug transport system fused ATPase/permease subunit
MKKAMKKRTAWIVGGRVFTVAVAIAIFTIVAVAGYAYSQNSSNRMGEHSAMHAQSSGMGSSGMEMTTQACDQMMQGLNISQSAINSMDNMMTIMSDNSSTTQDMMQND